MKTSRVALTLLLLVLLFQSGGNNDRIEPVEGYPAKITGIISEDALLKEKTMTTEIAAVQELRGDCVILQSREGETYVISNVSQFGVSIEENRELIFSYTEKAPLDEGGYVLTVKWLDNWNELDQSKFVHGT